MNVVYKVTENNVSCKLSFIENEHKVQFHYSTSLTGTIDSCKAYCCNELLRFCVIPYLLNTMDCVVYDDGDNISLDCDIVFDNKRYNYTSTTTKTDPWSNLSYDDYKTLLIDIEDRLALDLIEEIANA